MKRIDDLLNRITMYRLVLYYLIFLFGAATFFSAVGILKYNVFALLFSLAFLLVVCWSTNKLFARVFHIPANVESTYISALILALIINPVHSLADLWFLGWAAVLTMASKYIVAVNHKHIFNPVAFAVTVTYFVINRPASWWIGNGTLMPFVLIGGLLLVRKLGRFDLALSFLLTFFGIALAANIFSPGNLLGDLQKTLLYSSLFFFTSVILTEPLTTPPTRRLRIFYGMLTGMLASPQFHIGSLYLTPEMAMLAGNLFSYVVSPNTRVVLKLQEKIKIAPDIYDFVFTPSRRLRYLPGQYMEWTLGHKAADNRGNRRYFTLASAPSEDTIRMGIKFYQPSSTFKQALLAMNRGDEIIASQVAGDFVLPADHAQKCVLIAGGVGITPFRSMIQNMLDSCEKRPITLFYANNRFHDIVYQDVFERAQQELGMRTIYAVADSENLPVSWDGKIGFIDAQLITNAVPDYQECCFYISGPRVMVEFFQKTLQQMNVPASHIKTDFFPGF